MNLSTHLETLKPVETEAFRSLVKRLCDRPEQEPSEGLTARVMATVVAERGRTQHRRPWWGVAAAVLIISLTLAILRFTAGPLDATPTPGDPLAWLAQSQESDGTWSPARHGGAEAYRPALTALSALALASAPASTRYTHQVERACAALRALQPPEGVFRGSGREQAYNQVMTSYALTRLYSSYPQLKSVVQRAVAYSSQQQSAEGGWDYEAGSAGNAALTSWQVRMLAEAKQHGFSEAETPLRKGLRWVRGSMQDDGHVAYHRGSRSRSESLDALAAYALMTAGKTYPGLGQLGRQVADRLAPASVDETADCYRDYAKSLALDSAGARKQAEQIRRQMIAHQSAGSRDQWQGVGGRLYTTALTCLAANTHTP